MTNSLKLKFGVLGIIFIIGLVIYYGVFLFPIENKYKETITKLKLANDKLTSIKVRINDLPRIKNETKILQQEVEVLQKFLPQEKEIPALLRTLTQKTQKYGLRITTITPLKPEQKDHYTEIPYQIGLRGRYHLIGHFLTEISQQMRLMMPRDLSLIYSPSAEKGETANLSLEFVLTAFIYTQ